ncbi:MAG: hypothetical protein CM1200mP10_25030 [Candidatus Neomarinimicrobiota bacterium]|nr:MAG: hypothetical protein CM1200mP10_25030 [Candidatus Neomarinimicrobiota bacterium]
MRFIAGIFLGIIYVFRGFGPAAYAHTVYDLIVLTLVTRNYDGSRIIILDLVMV